MDETRKRYIVAGVVVGAVAVGLVVLAKRTPRDQWGETLGRIAKDALGLVRGQYGNNPIYKMAESTLDRFQENGDTGTALSEAFHEAVSGKPHRA